MTWLANTAARRRERRRRIVARIGLYGAQVAVAAAVVGISWTAALGDDRKCAAVRDLPGAAVVIQGSKKC